MKLKNLLMNAPGFNELLKQFAISIDDIIIKDEELIFSNENRYKEFLKERICIQGTGKNGIVNLFGILYCNLLSQLAVFELDFVDKPATIVY